MRLTLSLAAMAAALTATSAFAQAVPPEPVTDTATAEVRGLVLQPLTLTKVEDLDFGTVIGSAVAGTVVIDPDAADGSNRSVTGGVTAVASAAGTRAEFAGAGTPDQLVTLTMVAPVELVSTSNPSDKLIVTSLDFDSNGTNRQVGSDSTFTTYVGGEFEIAASQPNGLYSASFNVTASYQ